MPRGNPRATARSTHTARFFRESSTGVDRFGNETSSFDYDSPYAAVRVRYQQTSATDTFVVGETGEQVERRPSLICPAWLYDSDAPDGSGDGVRYDNRVRLDPDPDRDPDSEARFAVRGIQPIYGRAGIESLQLDLAGVS